MTEGIWTQVDEHWAGTLLAPTRSWTRRPQPPTPRLDATAVQTVGDEGYDGFVLALVR